MALWLHYIYKYATSTCTKVGESEVLVLKFTRSTGSILCVLGFKSLLTSKPIVLVVTNVTVIVVVVANKFHTASEAWVPRRKQLTGNFS